MKYLFTLLLSLCYLLPVVAQQLPLPKREFRGAWIQMINGQFMGMSRDIMQDQFDQATQCVESLWS